VGENVWDFSDRAPITIAKNNYVAAKFKKNGRRYVNGFSSWSRHYLSRITAYSLQMYHIMEAATATVNFISANIPIFNLLLHFGKHKLKHKFLQWIPSSIIS